MLYFTAFYQRVAPAVMTDQLMADFAIGAAALGNFSAFYFYSYVAMQIPTGILADSWGPRKLLITGAIVAGLGTLIFGMAPHIGFANLGRLLIGASVGVAWVALLKISTRWFPLHRYGFVTGVTLAVGVLGAVSAGAPLRVCINLFSWRPVMVVAAVLTLFLAIAIWRVVRDDPSEKGYKSYAPLLEREDHFQWQTILTRMRSILHYRNAWLLSLAPAGIIGPMLAFSGLWGVPYLSTLHGLPQAQAAAITSLMLVAMATGGTVLGALSDRMGRRKPLYLACAVLTLVCWTLVIGLPGLPLALLVVLLLAIGFAAGTIIVNFAFLKESLPLDLAGTVSGVCNMGVMLGPMILQPAIGVVLDRRWGGVIENGVRLYDVGAYRSAFLLMILFAVMALALVCFTRETYCRQIQ